MCYSLKSVNWHELLICTVLFLFKNIHLLIFVCANSLLMFHTFCWVISQGFNIKFLLPSFFPYNFCIYVWELYFILLLLLFQLSWTLIVKTLVTYIQTLENLTLNISNTFQHSAQTHRTHNRGILKKNTNRNRMLFYGWYNSILLHCLNVFFAVLNVFFPFQFSTFIWVDLVSHSWVGERSPMRYIEMNQLELNTIVYA